jgi:hypothetical protein
LTARDNRRHACVVKGKRAKIVSFNLPFQSAQCYTKMNWIFVYRFVENRKTKQKTICGIGNDKFVARAKEREAWQFK